MFHLVSGHGRLPIRMLSGLHRPPVNLYRHLAYTIPSRVRPWYPPMHAIDFGNTQQTVEAVQAGLPATLITSVRDRLGITLGDLATVLVVGERTLQRWLRRGEALPVDLSDRLAELIRLIQHAEEVLGPQAAVAWLTAEHPELGTTPLHYSRTSAGRRFVHDLLVAIQHGFVV